MNAGARRYARITVAWVALAGVVAAAGAFLLLTRDASTSAAEPLYVVVMTHVEGDIGQPEGSPTCPTDLVYQTLPQPPPGQPWSPSFGVDIAGTDLLREPLGNYRDSFGRGA